MKTFREIAEMHYASEPSNEFDKQYRENRITALEKLLTEQLRIHDVVGSYSEKDMDNAYDKGFKDAMLKYRTDL